MKHFCIECVPDPDAVCPFVFEPVCCGGRAFTNQCRDRTYCCEDDIVDGACPEPCIENDEPCPTPRRRSEVCCVGNNQFASQCEAHEVCAQACLPDAFEGEPF